MAEHALLYVKTDATVESNMSPLFSNGCHVAVERDIERKKNKTFHLKGTMGYLFILSLKWEVTLYTSES